MSSLTGGRRGSFAIVLAVMGMIAALVFVVPAIDASGQENSTTVQSDAGIILLKADSATSKVVLTYYSDPQVPTGSQTFAQANPTATLTQTLSISNKCGLGNLDNSLLDITRNGGRRVAVVSNGIGVGTKNNCSTSEGRISEGQTLTFTLDPSEFVDTYIERAEIDVEGKFGTDLAWSVSDGSQTQTGTEILTKSQDNGPDAGVGDNEIATIAPTFSGDDGPEPFLFTSVTLGPTASEVSIEGGGDGVVDGGNLRTTYKVNQTLFKLTASKTFDSGELDCGDVDDLPLVEGDYATGASLTRGENLPGAVYAELYGADSADDDCVPLAYTFAIQEGGVVFDANFEIQPTAHFTLRIDFAPGDGENGFEIVDPDNPPDRQIDFGLGDGFETRPKCEDFSGQVLGDPLALTPISNDDPDDDPLPDANDVYLHPTGDDRFANGIVPWCLAAEQIVLLPGGVWQQIQWYDGIGVDPNWK